VININFITIQQPIMVGIGRIRIGAVFGFIGIGQPIGIAVIFGYFFNGIIKFRFFASNAAFLTVCADWLFCLRTGLIS